MRDAIGRRWTRVVAAGVEPRLDVEATAVDLCGDAVRRTARRAFGAARGGPVTEPVELEWERLQLSEPGKPVPTAVVLGTGRDVGRPRRASQRM